MVKERSAEQSIHQHIMGSKQVKRPAWEELDASLSRQSVENKHQHKRARLFAGCDPFNAEATNAINGMFDRVIAIASSHIPHLAKAKKPRLTPLESNDPNKPQGRDTIATPSTPWHPMTHAEREARALEIGPGFRKSTWSILSAKTSIEDKLAPRDEQRSQNITPAVASTLAKRQWTPESDSSVVELLTSDEEEEIENQGHEQDEEAEASEENFDPDAEEESVQYDDEVDEYDENNPIQFEDTDEASETEDASGSVVRNRPEHVALRVSSPEHSKRLPYQARYLDRDSSPLEGSTSDYEEGLDDRDLNLDDVIDDEESERDPVDDEVEENSEGDYDDEEGELQTAEGSEYDLPTATNSDPYILLDSDEETSRSQEEEPDASGDEYDAPGDEYDEQGESDSRDEEYDEEIEQYSGHDEEDDRTGERKGQGDDYDDNDDMGSQDARHEPGDIQYSPLDDQDTQASVDFRVSDITVETVKLEEQDVMSLEGDSYTGPASQVFFESTDTLSHNMVTPGEIDLSVEQMQNGAPNIQFPVTHDGPAVGEFIDTQDSAFAQPSLAEVHSVQHQSVTEQSLVTHHMEDVHLLANFLEVHQSSHSQDVDAVVGLKESAHYAELVQPGETIYLMETVKFEEAVQHEQAAQYEKTAQYEAAIHTVELVDHDETTKGGHTHHEESTQFDEAGDRVGSKMGRAKHHNVPSLTDSDITPMETKDDDTSTSQKEETSSLHEPTPGVAQDASEEPHESPRNARLLRSGTMVITAREGRAFIERQERQEGTAVEGRTRKAHSAPTMMTRRAAGSESQQQAKDSQEDVPEVKSSPSPKFLPEADFSRSTPPYMSIRRGGGGEVDLLVKEAREFCGRVSPASRSGSSPGSLGGHYSAPIIAPPPLGHASPFDDINTDFSQEHMIDSSEKSLTSGGSRDAHFDTSSPTRMTPTKRGVVDLAEENVIQSTVVGSHALRKFIHPPASLGSSSHGTNAHGSSQAQSRSSSLEPVISPRTLHNNSMFSFGQNPLGLTLGPPPASPVFGSVPASAPASVGYGFGSTIAPGGAVARDQIMARSSPHKTRSQPSAPTKLSSEEPLYPVIENDLMELKVRSLEQSDEAQADQELEDLEEEGGASSEEEEGVPETGSSSSSSSPLFVLKTKKKKSPAQVKARNKARRVAAKNQKSAKAQPPI